MKNIPLFLLVAAGASSFAGIIRSDVSSEKYVQLGQEKQFDCVGQVFKNDTLPLASCVLIDSHHALSAAHAFMDHDIKPDTIKTGNQTMIAFRPINERLADPASIQIVFNAKKWKVKSITLHPNYRNKETKGTCDLAILELEEAVKLTPAHLSSATDELKSTIVGVGYGQTGPADQPNELHPSKVRIAGENVIDSIGGERYNGIPITLFCDFDHPTRTDCNKMGSAQPLDLEYIGGAGDSGGGVFRKTKGKWELVAICQGVSTDINQLIKSGYYGQVWRLTRLSPFGAWLKGELGKK